MVGAVKRLARMVRATRSESLFSQRHIEGYEASDGMPNWLMREYAQTLAPLVSSVLSSSFVEQRLPPSWKQADVVPIPKLKSVSNAKKHLRPISVTPAFSKIADGFVVSIHVVLKKIFLKMRNVFLF